MRAMPTLKQIRGAIPSATGKMKELADKTGGRVHWTTFYRIRQGIGEPRKVTLEVIAKALGL